MADTSSQHSHKEEDFDDEFREDDSVSILSPGAAATEDDQSVCDYKAEGQPAAGGAESEINDKVFEQLRMDPEQAQAVHAAWQALLRSMDSREAVGEAIYSVLYEAAPSVQGLFKTPRGVMALRLAIGFGSIFGGLGDPAALKVTVETLGFQHLELEVTVPRVATFRDALVELFSVELGEALSPVAREGIRTVLSWAGGAFIYIRLRYAERFRILVRSWAKVNNTEVEDIIAPGEGEEGDENPEQGSMVLAEGAGPQDVLDVRDDSGERQASGQKARKPTFLGKLLGRKPKKVAEVNGISAVSKLTAREKFKKEGSQNSMDSNGRSNSRYLGVPRTYNEMFQFNAAVMGFAGNEWMYEVLQSFDTIVRNASNSYRLSEECDVLSLRIAKCTRGFINLSEYKNVMLASLRSLLPKDWNSAHEVAWSWLWENVERMLKALLGKPAAQEKALGTFLSSLDEAQRALYCREVYAQFFILAPTGQDFFKQSTTRLYWIADKVASFTIEMYEDPRAMVENLSGVGLRHVGFGIPTELFGPFVDAAVSVVRKLARDPLAEEAFRWSMSLISRIMVRAINEGSTVVMKAINVNSARQLRKAVGCAPRGKRATWMLNITVGTQSISPLVWAMESGAMDAAKAILVDLLTIRADRERYYYGAAELFDRHPDIVKLLCQDAPNLLPTILDGLVWRSRMTDKGLRRVNYYVKHLLLEKDGSFSSALRCISDLKDPKLACHPIIVFLSDSIWTGVTFSRFMRGRIWLIFTILIFILSQSVLRTFAHQTAHQWARPTVFGLRMFIYLLGMGELWYTQIKRTCKDFKEDAVEKVWRIWVPTRYLEDYQEVVSVMLATALLGMLSHCPVLYCFGEFNNDFEGKGVLTEVCPGAYEVLLRYSVMSATAMFLYFLRAVDLAVFSNRLCAYVLMCGYVLPEVALFLFALIFTIIAFSCAVGALAQDIEEFQGIPSSALSFLEMSMQMFDSESSHNALRSGWLFTVMVLFVIVTSIYLSNLLIAQVSASFQAIYFDMLGYARIRRLFVICNTMPQVSKDRWAAWVRSLRLDEPLEFNEGDVGLPGGLQVREPANANPTTTDAIRRVGGSTNPATPWPEEEDEEEGDLGRMDRIDRILQRIAKQMSSTKAGRGGKSRSHAGGGSSRAGASDKSESLSSE